MSGHIKYAEADHARGLPIPWWGKLGAKLVLHHTPGARRIAERLGLFRPGDLASNVERVVGGFQEHLSVYRDRVGKKPEGVLELGVPDELDEEPPELPDERASGVTGRDASGCCGPPAGHVGRC